MAVAHCKDYWIVDRIMIEFKWKKLVTGDKLWTKDTQTRIKKPSKEINDVRCFIYIYFYIKTRRYLIHISVFFFLLFIVVEQIIVALVLSFSLKASYFSVVNVCSGIRSVVWFKRVWKLIPFETPKKWTKNKIIITLYPMRL